jgi:hypothetical protein
MMKMHEYYARGVVTIESGRMDDEELANLAQYALDLQKLRHAHEDQCKDCRRTA